MTSCKLGCPGGWRFAGLKREIHLGSSDETECGWDVPKVDPDSTSINYHEGWWRCGHRAPQPPGVVLSCGRCEALHWGKVDPDPNCKGLRRATAKVRPVRHPVRACPAIQKCQVLVLFPAFSQGLSPLFESAIFLYCMSFTHCAWCHSLSPKFSCNSVSCAFGTCFLSAAAIFQDTKTVPQTVFGWCGFIASQAVLILDGLDLEVHLADGKDKALEILDQIVKHAQAVRVLAVLDVQERSDLGRRKRNVL